MMLYKVSFAFSAFSLLLFIGCGGVTTGTNLSNRSSPDAPTVSISADRTTINKGDSVTLSWSSTGAYHISISRIGRVVDGGTEDIKPAETTNYQIAATGFGGTSTAHTEVHVQPQVIFIGDSITQFWTNYCDFAENNWIDKGISGQTATEIAARFQSDVIDKHPDAVHILAGTNSLIPVRNAEDPRGPLAAMIAQAHAANIAVFVGTVPPWGDGPVATQWDDDYLAHNEQIGALNAWIQAQPGIAVIDYHTALDDENGFYNQSLTTDGVHPSGAGFAAMTSLAKQAIDP